MSNIGESFYTQFLKITFLKNNNTENAHYTIFSEKYQNTKLNICLYTCIISTLWEKICAYRKGRKYTKMSAVATSEWSDYV